MLREQLRAHPDQGAMVQATKARTATPSLFPPIDPDDAARVARVGAILDSLVPSGAMPGLLVALGRISLGWSQERLADEIGIGRSTVGKIESGRQPITRDRALLLAGLLGIPHDMLET